MGGGGLTKRFKLWKRREPKRNTGTLQTEKVTAHPNLKKPGRFGTLWGGKIWCKKKKENGSANPRKKKGLLIKELQKSTHLGILTTGKKINPHR